MDELLMICHIDSDFEYDLKYILYILYIQNSRYSTRKVVENARCIGKKL